jgi:hypothetical protein
MQNNKIVLSVAPSFTTMLAILFIALKLTEVIQWSWLWVLAPIWLPLASVFSCVGLVGLIIIGLALMASPVKKGY